MPDGDASGSSCQELDDGKTSSDGADAEDEVQTVTCSLPAHVSMRRSQGNPHGWDAV